MKLIKVEKVDEEFLKEVVRRIVSAVDPVKIILFGSHAYGKPKKGSDLDIMVVVDKIENTRREIVLRIREALSDFLIGKDIVVVTTQEIEDWKEVPQAFVTYVVKRGRILYEKKIDLVKLWIKKAENDLVAAEHLLTVRPHTPYDTICFHAQQCAEKYLRLSLSSTGLSQGACFE